MFPGYKYQINYFYIVYFLALPSSYSSSEALCHKIEELEKVLKKEREVDVDVDIISMEEQEKPCIKKENENGDDDKFYLTPTLSCEFIRDTAQEVKSRWSF